MAGERIYVDTSAFYALLDRADQYHDQAKTLWPALLKDTVFLVTSDHVVSETVTLLQYRLGFEAASLWYKNVLAVLDVQWADRTIQRQAYSLWMSLGRQRFSLVDCVSFVTMHQQQIEKVFSFKAGFAQQGFSLLPDADACMPCFPIPKSM